MISYEKEVQDSIKLAAKIVNDNWIDNDTILVCCSPDYSSIVTQILNHKLSYLNDHELFEQIGMEMPYPNSKQVWNHLTSSYDNFDRYVVNFIQALNKEYKYLFIDSATIRGKNFNRLLQCTQAKEMDVKYASLYVEEKSIFMPDYFVEKFSSSDEELIFSWENPNNKNWL